MNHDQAWRLPAFPGACGTVLQIATPAGDIDDHADRRESWPVSAWHEGTGAKGLSRKCCPGAERHIRSTSTT